MAALQENVLRRDVAVDHAALVRVLQHAGHFTRELRGVGDRQLRFAVEPRAQRLACLIGHHVEQLPAGLAAVEERENVRMLRRSS